MNGHQVHEKVLNITNYEGNTNQNHSDIPLHTYYQKDKRQQVLVEKGNSCTLLVGM